MLKESEGVWVADPGVIHFTRDDISFLIGEAPKTPKRRARICAHSQDDKVHQMLIAFCADSYNPLHVHKKMESVSVIQGTLKIVWLDRPETVMHAGDFLRIPAGVVHQPLPLTDCVILETAEK